MGDWQIWLHLSPLSWYTVGGFVGKEKQPSEYVTGCQRKSLLQL